MKSRTEPVIVFYAWQDDLPHATNRTAIMKCLRTAASELEKRYHHKNLHIIIDEATRGEPGAPNIPNTVREKIEASDVFVCDVTPVSELDVKDVNHLPNPNVVFELGFAVAHLGWKRIIMLFNKTFGEFPKDLPFDFDRHRASPYKIVQPKNGPVSDDSALTKLITVAVEVVINSDPPRPSEMIAIDPKTLRRQRDLKMLRLLLETVHWPSLQDHMEEGPKVIRAKVFYFWEEFNSIFTSPIFHLNDGSLVSKFKKVHRLWELSLSFDPYYMPAVGQSGDVFFGNPGGQGWSREQHQAWRDIEVALKELYKVVVGLLKTIRKNYVEIDLEEINSVAWNKYIEHEDSIEQFSKKLKKKPKQAVP
jgi:hypothetical protein